MTAGRFLCDAMLSGLGKWLRAAGHDTAFAPARHVDRTLVRMAHDERRLLLTRDRKILEIRDAAAVTRIVRAQHVDDQAAELTAAVGIDWLHDPLSRCLLCNGILREAREDALDQVPRNVRLTGGPFTYCDRCGKVYWPGGHHDRILHRLYAFAREGGGVDGV
jgi:uncharacterized protein with PIN domain